MKSINYWKKFGPKELAAILFAGFTFLGASIFAATLNRADLDSGVYYGQKGGGFAPFWNVFVLVGDKITVETYSHIKGQIVRGPTESIEKDHRTPDGGYQGASMVIQTEKDGWGISAEQGRLKFHLKKVNSGKLQDLARLQNRAFLHQDYYDLAQEVESKRPDIANASGMVEKMRSDLGAEKLADRLTHEEFLAEYKSMREKIISEVLRSPIQKPLVH